jgi:hypothetical protein
MAADGQQCKEKQGGRDAERAGNGDNEVRKIGLLLRAGHSAAFRHCANFTVRRRSCRFPVLGIAQLARGSDVI